MCIFHPNTLPFRTHTPVPSVFILERFYCAQPDSKSGVSCNVCLYMPHSLNFLSTYTCALRQCVYPKSYILLSVAIGQRNLHSMCLLLSGHWPQCLCAVKKKTHLSLVKCPLLTLAKHWTPTIWSCMLVWHWQRKMSRLLHSEMWMMKVSWGEGRREYLIPQ